ncbi:MAG: hypothetical protein AAB927_02280 [Patescibacteria group bacterium]
MSQDLAKSFEQIKQLASALPVILDLAKPLELLKDTSVLERKHNDASAALDKVEQDLRDAQQKLKLIDGVVASSHAESVKIAKHISDKAFEDAKPEIAKITSRVAELNSDCSAKKSQLDALNVEIADRQLALEELENKIALVKSAAAKSLGL